MHFRNKVRGRRKSIYSNLIEEWKYPILYRSWRTAIYRPVQKIFYNLTKRPYYFLKWYEISRSSTKNKWEHQTIFKTWRLRDPLNFNITIRQNVGKIHSHYDCPSDDCVYRDRCFKRYLWSKKLRYQETSYTCYACLFAPVEDYYSSGGMEGGMYFGSNSSWDRNERSLNV